MTTQTPDAVREALEPIRKLLDASDNPWKVTTLPWEVVPSDGKPIIASNRHGNLFRGYIATWAEANLLVAIANAMPAVIAALDSRAGDAGEVRIPRNVAILIDQAFLPSNPARMRAAAPEVIEAAKAFKAILATTVPAAR